MRKFIVIAVFAVAFFAIAADQWFAGRDRRFESLRQQYECFSRPCLIDIDGDSVAEELAVQLTDSDKKPHDWILLKDGTNELLRLPYHLTDGTLRTHLAIRSDKPGPRLLVFDGARSFGIGRAVFRWDGNQVAAIEPDSLDEEILSAMAADDDAGTRSGWTLFRLQRRVLYLILGFGILATGLIVFRKSRVSIKDA